MQEVQQKGFLQDAFRTVRESTVSLASLEDERREIESQFKEETFEDDAFVLDTLGS